MSAQLYTRARAQARASGYHTERGDCTVVATSIAFELTYSQAYRYLASLGRRPGCGFNLHNVHGAMQEDWEVTVEQIPVAIFRRSKHARTISAPVFEREARDIFVNYLVELALARGDFNPYEVARNPVALLYMSRHVAAFRDWRVQDWSRHRRKRIYQIYLLLPRRTRR